MRVIDPGHVYCLNQLGGGTQMLTFVKRSGGIVKYEKEWPGLQTQEVLRALIDRTKYLDTLIPCGETKQALEHLRKALWCYELRAFRRKQQGLNRHSGAHDETGEAPFDYHEIETISVADDGHLQTAGLTGA